MEIMIRQGREEEIDELSRLYDAVNDHLACTVNYPGWTKGVYPAREDAEQGIAEGCLYVAVADGAIVGTVILRHEPEPAYRTVEWQARLEDEQVLVIYTLAVHPEHLSEGVGRALIGFAAEHGPRAGVKALRLDVYEKNVPAIRLYEGCGFQYIATVDLSLAEFGLDRFKLYEKLL